MEGLISGQNDSVTKYSKRFMTYFAVSLNTILYITDKNKNAQSAVYKIIRRAYKKFINEIILYFWGGGFSNFI